MTFTRKSADLVPIVDTVFSIVELAKKDKEQNGEDMVIDATIGSLYDEEGKLVAFDNVFEHYDDIDKITKAKYAASFTGNPNYRQDVFDWVCEDKIKLAHSTIATIGGTGAVSMTVSNILDKGQTLIIPDIAWGSYKLMAAQFELSCVQYEMFDDHNQFNMASFKETILATMQKQDKILVIINDPCHNPTGASLTNEQWQEIIHFANECSKQVPFVILNDIAYIDYAYDLLNSRDYMQNFNAISNNVLINIAFSCSKTLTSYGLRCGACIILAKDAKAVRETEIVFEKSARAIWSNIPNAAMVNFSWLTTQNKQSFLAEKQRYIDLLKQRADIFIKEANQCDLPIYPYKEGFFITIKMSDNATRDQYHQKLMDNHIYTVCVNKGIRVAICSLSLAKTKGLASKMKALL
ncbi:MAG: aminotransferase class I/II-fold pyridoxal phosphate-dependent enzyme [Erysipelotrichaceae bacterium]|nr:aminotransferase class I/II-fold pyridoxal phosphate-dependent enzyme [Erysipelotrichaceae bacterium]MDY5252027.1 aminotransferase class I/II-fold pyridoxal phosphate-dependent enzyme [Erysipelotrichaceae bacterium]